MLPVRRQSSLATSGGDVLGGCAAHQLQRLADFAVGKNVEEGGLFEIDGQRLLQGAVEDRVAGGVDEVGEDDSVFLGERRSFVAGAAERERK